MLMRRAPFFAILSAGLLSVAGLLRAGDSPPVDFDNGRDASGIIEHARKQGRLRYALPLDPIKEAGPQPAGLETLPALPEPSIEVETTGRLELPTGTGCEQDPGKDDPGGETPSLCAASKAATRNLKAAALVPVTGPYEPLPRDNPEYKESIALRERIIGDVGVTGTIPPPVREALLNRWNLLDAKRTELIQAARPLDTDDERLSRFARRLNVWLDRINQRRTVLNANAATYNRLCLGRPLPDDEFRQCEAYRSRFNNCVDRHNASLGERNRLAGVWQSGKQCLESRGIPFREMVANWANRTVKIWNLDATKALAGGCRKVKSVRITPANPVPLRTGGDTLTLQGFPVHEEGEGSPCPIVSWEWSKFSDDGDIGTLTPLSDPSMAQLVTGPREGVGSVILKVTDSMKNTAERAVPVRVSAAVDTCELDALASHPRVRDICVYKCAGSRPSGPLDVYGMPDPANPGQLKCRPFILQP